LKNNFLIYISIFFLVSAISLFSQTEISRNINIDDGLAYSQVTCAFKDSKSIMWFGTSAGLSKWNGIEFINYYNFNGLPSSFVTDISEDKSSNLFVATKKGLVVKDGPSFVPPKNIPNQLNSQINKLLLTQNGMLFILTEKYGLWKMEQNSYVQISANKTKIIPKSILERTNGDILIGTEANGVYKLDGDTLKQIIYHKIYKMFPVVDLVELSSDSLYIALQGLGVILKSKIGEQKKGNNFITTKNNLPSSHITDLEITSDKKLYIATTKGIAVVKKDKIVKTISQKNGLLNEFVLKIFTIKDDSFFFLTEGNGIFLYAENSFLTYTKNDGLLHNNVWSIKELKNGSICFLTDKGVSFLKENKFTTTTGENGLGDNLVISLYEAENGDLYLGTYSDGVNKISNEKIDRLNQKIGMPKNSVWSILEYKKDTLFFVTHSKGIAVYDGKKIIDTLGINDGLPSNSILSSFKMKDGTILIGSENGGIYKYDGKQFHKHFKDIENYQIWDIYEDKNGVLYFGSNENGLFRYHPNGKKNKITVKDGLSNNSVIAVEGDDLGNIYAATDRGLNIIKFSKDGEFKIKQIYKQSGLASSECNQGAVYKDEKGYIWVGTIGGVTRINPIKMDNSDNIPQIIISSIKIMDKEYFPKSKNETIVLNHDNNDISFAFAGINYCNPQTINYRFKLNPVDDKWTFDKTHVVRYSNLSPGQYNFSVTASNSWGVWSEPMNVEFIINKPYWATWWFILLILLIIIGIIYSIFNYRLKNIMRLEKLRSSISADLHDEIGSGLSEISILSELLKLNLKNKNELQKGLEHIGDTTRSLIERLSDIIWIVNPRKETFKNLILRIHDNYQEVLYHTDISLNIINLELLENIILPLEIKQNLYLITKEAINNSLKYSECNNIDFEVNKRENKLCIEIRDDGKGFEKESSEKGNGLYNIKKRAEKIQANVTIDSTINKGTKIRVEVFMKKLRKSKI
jgi:ligand-binding sensor domain-containing protein